MLFNFPKSHIHIEAKKLKLLGSYSFEYFSELIKSSLEAQKPLLAEDWKKIKDDFMEKIDLFYFDILFSGENDGNQNIKILQRQKNVVQKEIILEITGLSQLLDPKDSIIDQ